MTVGEFIKHPCIVENPNAEVWVETGDFGPDYKCEEYIKKTTGATNVQLVVFTCSSSKFC